MIDRQNLLITTLYEFDNFCIFYCINNTFDYIFAINKVTELCAYCGNSSHNIV